MLGSGKASSSIDLPENGRRRPEHLRRGIRQNLRRGLLLSIALVGYTVQAHGQIPHGQDTAPGPALSVDEALARMVVPDGFTIECVAQEPDLVNPVAMTFDDRGRIWVTESLEYPSHSPEGDDRVKILEDTDGDGKIDRTKTFADGLSIPSGIAIGHGGVWVANAPDILFLQDTDGDDVADTREVVVTGFGRADTHELPNSLTWGPDGWLYGLNGVFNPCHVVQGDREWRFTCAVFRIHPITHEFQLFARGTSNPWGIAFDDTGSLFVSACVIDHLWHLAETGTYRRQAGSLPPFSWQLESIVDHRHQKAAYCGLHWLDNEAWPAAYRKRLYMGNIHGSCVNVDEIRRHGATFFGTPNDDFVSARDAWFMTVSQKTGPDGCLYVLDWYDRYHCYQDAKRDPEGIDRKRGRLYRVRYGDAVTPIEDLRAKSEADLIADLAGPHDWLQTTARRILQERTRAGGEGVASLERLIADETAPPLHRLRALWAVGALRPLSPATTEVVLNTRWNILRAWGIRLIGNHGAVPDGMNDLVRGACNAPSPIVQAQCVIAAGKLSRDHRDDDEQALISLGDLASIAQQTTDDPLVPALVWNQLRPILEERPRDVLQCADVWRKGTGPGVRELVGRVTERLIHRDRDTLVTWCRTLFEEAGHGPVVADAVRKLGQDAHRGGPIAQSPEVRDALIPLIDSLAVRGQGELAIEAALLGAHWGGPESTRRIRELATDREISADRRLRAIDHLLASDADITAWIRPILRDEDSELVEETLSMLSNRSEPEVATLLVEAYGDLSNPLQSRIVEILGRRATWAFTMVEAIGRGEVPAGDLRLHQVLRLHDLGDEALSEALHQHWGRVRTSHNPAREMRQAAMRADIRAGRGDPLRGVEVFEKNCATCHTIYGQGANVGPDLTHNGRGSLEQLLSNVFDPSLVIGAGYRGHTLFTHDGRTLTGLVRADHEHQVELVTEGGEVEIIPRDLVDELRENEKSLMPERIEETLTDDQLRDLFAYLTLDGPPDADGTRPLPGMRAVREIETYEPTEFTEIIREVAPGFATTASGDDGVALLPEFRGRKVVVRTHPLNRREPNILRGRFQLSPEGPDRLLLSVGHHPRGDWKLVVRLQGSVVKATSVGPDTATDGWLDLSIDLSDHLGEEIELVFENHATGWHNEYAYWGRAVFPWDR